MKQQYNHVDVENKWKNKWKERNIYATPKINEDKEKKYILDMFPYPSGVAMHVGHAEGYIGTDIMSRYYRMKGYKVLHPMGWDAFGLPAENFAIKTGIHPRINTDNAIETFKEQLDILGLSYDWDREIASHRPDYYKWTQWFFLFLYKRGLAYKKEAPVNWCDNCKTVLANEQVVDGKCERCDTVVVQKNMSQWFFKITEYADRLIDDLAKVDWPESTKTNQINWIGRSEGAEIDFKIEGSDKTLKIFTTRLDTIYGATFMVIAPEHPLIRKITTSEQTAEVESYIEETSKKTELERTALEKEKTGAFTGAYAINPFNNQRIPIWTSNFVLVTYGTGAIMAVPGHDERDHEFAEKFGLKIIPVIEPGDSPLPYPDKGNLVNSCEYDGLSSQKAFSTMAEKAEKEGFGQKKVNYKLRDWLVSRQRYWGAPIPIVYDGEGHPVLVDEKDLPVILPDDVEFKPTGVSPLTDHEGFHNVGEKYGKGAKRESDTFDTFVDSSWYFFRFVDPDNTGEFASKDSLKSWCPVDIYVGGAEHTVLHLLYARFFTKALYDAGYIDFDEPFSALRHQGMILGEDSRKMSKRWGNVVDPREVGKEYGIDSLRVYEMFMGPFDAMKPWSTSGLQGARRFLDRVYKMKEKIGENTSQSVESALHRLIKKVGEDIVDLKFNTAVAELMKFVNLVEDEQTLTASQWRKFFYIFE
ncbi:MAG: leucine--tRNA ligase [Candidatus Dojkabacteria bacterium]